MYGLEESDVMSLQERVAEAQRVAKMDLRELEDKGQGGVRGGRKKKTFDDGNDDTEMSSGVRKRVRNSGSNGRKR